MTLHKKIFYWFISLVVIVGLIYIGGILFIKNYKPATKVAQQQLTTPTGMIRDRSGTIPAIFKGLVDINDVKVVQESYSYAIGQLPVRQYTLKYISDKSFETVQKDTMDLLSGGVYKTNKVQVDDHTVSIRGVTKENVSVDFLINNIDPSGVLVEITVFK